MMNNFKRFQSSILLILAVFVSVPVLVRSAYAEDTASIIEASSENDLEAEGEVSPLSESQMEAEEEEDHLSIKDIDFNTVESSGLLEQSRGEGLGKQFYSNSKRSAITALVQAMPNSNWTVLQDLSNEVLLTSANTAVLDNDVAINSENGNDLLTLRIEKLLQRGFNKEAYALYTRLKIDPYNEKIARLGITSMLINAEKPLACVEMKTFDAPFKTDIFWKEMDAYCILSLSSETFPEKAAIINASKHPILKRIVQDKAFRFSYTPQTFEALTQFEKSLLIGENRLDISGLNENSFKHIPAEHVQALLALHDLDNTTKILLSARGVEAGVISPYDFGKTYIKIGRKAEKEKKALAGFEHVSTLYWKHLDTFLPESRQATISEILGYAKQHGYVILVPFLEDLSNLTPSDSMTIDDVHAIVRAFFLAGSEMPAQWLDFIKALPTAGIEQEKTKEILLISAALMSGDKGNSPEKLKEIYDILKKPKNSALANLKNIIENIDNRTGSYAKVHFAYEKGFDLVMNKSYTMPPAALIDQLELSSKGHATGETVLLCNLILQGIEQRSIYPGILADVARALSEVGLGKQSQRLLAEVVLSIGN